MRNEIPELMAGDTLLYLPSNIIGHLICWKTWSRFAHIEVYAGKGKSVASRDGRGVNIYPVRYAQLGAVYRPLRRVNVEKAMVWFYREACGQKYGYWDLLKFYLIVNRRQKKGLICSQFGALFYRASGFDVFNHEFDAGCIAPADYPMSPQLEKIWER